MLPHRAERGLRPGLLATVLALAACGSPPPAQNPGQRAATQQALAAARLLERGDLGRARAQYEVALASAESVEDFELAGTLLLNLAAVHARAGELAAAHARVDRILAAPQRYPVSAQAAAAARKAMLHADAAELDAVLRWAAAAQARCAAPCVLEATLGNLRAFVALQRDDPSAAAGAAAGAAALAAATGQDAEHANALRLLGRAQGRLGQADAAVASIAAALAIDQRLGLPERIALDLVDAGEVEQRRARTDAAREFFERAIAVYRAAGRPRDADRVRQRLDALPRGARAPD